MNEQKMRDALITAREVLRLEGYPDNNVAMVKIHSALALQPAAGVELTDDDFVEAVKPLCKSHDIAVQLVRYSRDEYRAVIAAHEAKKSGGGV